MPELSDTWYKLQQKMKMTQLISLKIQQECLFVTTKYSEEESFNKRHNLRSDRMEGLHDIMLVLVEKIKEISDAIHKENARPESTFWRKLFGPKEEKFDMNAYYATNRQVLMDFYEVVESLRVIAPEKQGYQDAIDEISRFCNVKNKEAA
jgi:hypothetical protein